MRQSTGHAAMVFGAFTLLFAWIFGQPLLKGSYLAESDLFDIFLPIFLSPRMVWSSYEFSGMPTFADPENMEFYPLHWLFSEVIGSWTGFIASAYVLGACFMYAYVYFHTRSTLAAAVSGTVFALSEAMLERLPHPVIVHALAWLPLILLAIDRVRQERRRTLWMAIGGFAAANCVLAGHPQIPVYIAVVCAAYVAANAVAATRRPVFIGSVAVMALLGAMAASVTLLPVIEASTYLEREGIDFAGFTSYSNTPSQMLSILFPTISHVGREAPTYAGLAALLLAPLALLGTKGNWRPAFWAAVVLVSLVLGVGAATPLAALAFELPLYENFRIVARHLVFAACGLAVLAGFGVAAVQRTLPLRTLWIAAATLMAAMIAVAMLLASRPAQFQFEQVHSAVALPWWNGGIWVQLLVATLVIASCAMVNRRPQSALLAAVLLLVIAGDLVHAQPRPVHPTGVSFETVPARALEPSVHTRRLAEALQEQQQRLLIPRGAHTNDILHSVFARTWGIPSAGGYTSMLLRHTAVLGQMGMTGRVASRALAPDDRSLDLLAIRYIAVNPDTMTGEEGQYLAADTRWREATRIRTSRETDRDRDEDAAGETEYVIFENLRALPRAWLAREIVPVTDGTMEDSVRASRALRDGRDIDLEEVALVLEGAHEPRLFPAGDADATVESIQDGAIRVRTSSDGGGFLVLSETYYPGWRARIDGGEPQAVTPAFFALQGIEVPPGDHEVLFEFASATRRIGAWMSAAGVLALALLAVVGIKA